MDFGANELTEASDGFVGTNAFRMSTGSGGTGPSCSRSLDDAPLVVSSLTKVRYERLVKPIECADE